MGCNPEAASDTPRRCQDVVRDIPRAIQVTSKEMAKFLIRPRGIREAVKVAPWASPSPKSLINLPFPHFPNGLSVNVQYMLDFFW